MAQWQMAQWRNADLIQMHNVVFLDEVRRGTGRSKSHHGRIRGNDPRSGFSNVCIRKIGRSIFYPPTRWFTSYRERVVPKLRYFLFALIGAVSIWMRMYSWVSFVNIIIGVWIATLSLIKILGRRFWYRYFLSDQVLVSALLILGCAAYPGVLITLIYDLMELPDREHLSFYSLAPKATSEEVVQPSLCPSGYKTALLMTSGRDRYGVNKLKTAAQ
ncbi:hypothetical protein PsorP6_008771 [Peronosclerospora sorghi]|uniref:Uncharacterized protein n=1 Tax=Peronosclerospora sorghi TaxID=230839 RepID=A0ACC0W079_9STRA|nr:hypothetical protein PsorP6_008771 [Peronosclerospora sorghi]